MNVAREVQEGQFGGEVRRAMTMIPNLRYSIFAMLGMLAGCGDAASQPGPAHPGAPGSGADASTSGGGHDASVDARTPLSDGATPPSGDDDDASAPSDASTPPPSGALVAYASGYGPNISVFAVNADGSLSLKSTTPAVSSPSFLAIDRAVTHVYAVSEETAGRVAAYSIDKGTGALTYLNDVSSNGDGPAHVAIDATGKWVIAANYGDGTVSVLPVQADGKLGNATDTQAVGANAHMAAIDPSNQFVFVPCKGADAIAQFKLSNGKLVANATKVVKTAAGAGPRHIAFHPNGKYAYLINENNSTMTGFTLDATGSLTPIETKSTLPTGFSGTNTGAEVWVHPSGMLVYGSNRGDNSIVAFTIDPATGKMTLKGHTKSGGKTPRDFTLDATGKFLYSANQDSSNVVPFAIDAAGALAPVGAPVSVDQASFIGVVRLPAP